MSTRSEAVTPIRIGVLRSANASPDPVVALAEARVIRHELTRRLGEVSVDLRSRGSAIGPWEPVEHAAWPSDVDAAIDLDDGTGDSGLQLTTLFGRTLDPRAVEVRRRMLTHLGVLPIDRLDDDTLARRLPAPRRPTDVWILLRDAEQVEVADEALRALATDVDVDGTASSAVDAWIDRAVDGLGLDPAPTVARLQRQVDDLTAELAATADAARRAERLATERIDELSAECDALRERLERTRLDADAR
ncbi:MAG: hypothetical protein CL424_18995 [Acidimicrobiaceae bacterium]|nr:hypothetical protein [Acidimicrobiaceae bacterium]